MCGFYVNNIKYNNPNHIITPTSHHRFTNITSPIIHRFTNITSPIIHRFTNITSPTIHRSSPIQSAIRSKIRHRDSPPNPPKGGDKNPTHPPIHKRLFAFFFFFFFFFFLAIPRGLRPAVPLSRLRVSRFPALRVPSPLARVGFAGSWASPRCYISYPATSFFFYAEHDTTKKKKLCKKKSE